jgi:hypothetical protein
MSSDPIATPGSPRVRTTTYVLNFSPTRSIPVNNHLLRIPAGQQSPHQSPHQDEEAALTWARGLLARWAPGTHPFDIAYFCRVDPVPEDPSRVERATLRLFYRMGSGGLAEALPGEHPREALARAAGRASS